MFKLHKVLICGDRDWNKYGPIRRDIKRLVKKHGSTGLLIIEGECPYGGADVIARYIAEEEFSVHVARIHALWSTRYRGAGPQRNTMMRMLEPDEWLAYHKDISRSRGTKNMVQQLTVAGIPGKVRSK